VSVYIKWIVFFLRYLIFRVSDRQTEGMISKYCICGTEWTRGCVDTLFRCGSLSIISCIQNETKPLTCPCFTYVICFQRQSLLLFCFKGDAAVFSSFCFFFFFFLFRFARACFCFVLFSGNFQWIIKVGIVFVSFLCGKLVQVSTIWRNRRNRTGFSYRNDWRWLGLLLATWSCQPKSL